MVKHQSLQPSGIITITPSARRLTESLRDIGYEFTTALADIVDNAVTAGATHVDVEINFDGAESHVLVADNGSGMTAATLDESLRFGSRRSYELGELGRFGLGLKTASISQCRRLTVVSRHAPKRRRLTVRCLDLNHIAQTDCWELTDPPIDSAYYRSLKWLNDSPGTVVVWEELDRLLPAGRPDGGWAKRRLQLLASKASEYLGMVFHRFIEGTARREHPLVITINGEKVRPWNPFAPFEDDRAELPALTIDVDNGAVGGTVRLARFVLPTREGFSSADEFERLGGPQKWNRQQGIYIYRSDRMIQHGGWCGLRAADEHTKIARASLDFETDLDDLFHINVAKMRVALPPELRPLIERPIAELCHTADARYRRASTTRDHSPSIAPEGVKNDNLARLGGVIIAAALGTGDSDAIMRIIEAVQRTDPQAASALGW